MTNKLKEYFPLLWEREELLAEIGGSRELHACMRSGAAHSGKNSWISARACGG